MREKSIKGKLISTCLCIIIAICGFTNISIFAKKSIKEGNYVIDKIKMPIRAVEGIAMQMEARFLNEFNLYKKNDDIEFRVIINNFIFIPEYIKEDNTGFTGKWTIIYGEEQEIQETLQLSPNSMFIYLNDEYLLARSDNNLIYIPIEDNTVLKNKVEIIDRFSDKFIERLARMKDEWSDM